MSMKVINGSYEVVELTNDELIIFEKLKTVDEAIPKPTILNQKSLMEFLKIVIT